MAAEAFALALLAVYPAQLESERDSNRARARTPAAARLTSG